MADTNQAQGSNAGGQQPPLKVNIPDEVKKGIYANAVSVSVTSNEVTVDFGYLLPNTATAEIEVVGRVNMNHRTAESFQTVLEGAMQDFKKKQAEHPNLGATAPASAPVTPAPAPAPAPAAPHAPAASGPMPPMPPTAPGGPTPIPNAA